MLVIERLAAPPVQLRMRRVKIMLVSLLLLPWLAVAGHGFTRAPVNSAAVQWHTSVAGSSAVQGQSGPRKDACSPGKSARHVNRRAGFHSNLERIATPWAVSGCRLSGLGPVRMCFNGAETAFDLAKSWQFYWRTALEPRAPSAVS